MKAELSEDYIRYEVIDLLYKKLPDDTTLEEFGFIVEEVLNLINKIYTTKEQ